MLTLSRMLQSPASLHSLSHLTLTWVSCHSSLPNQWVVLFMLMSECCGALVDCDKIDIIMHFGKGCTCIYNNVKVHTQTCIYQPHRHHLSHTHNVVWFVRNSHGLSGQDQWAHAMNTLIYAQHLDYTHRYTHNSTQPTLLQLPLHLPP